MVEDWGASDIRSNPVITALISARDTTGHITGSRFIIRGNVFHAGQDPSQGHSLMSGYRSGQVLGVPSQREGFRVVFFPLVMTATIVTKIKYSFSFALYCR